MFSKVRDTFATWVIDLYFYYKITSKFYFPSGHGGGYRNIRLINHIVIF